MQRLYRFFDIGIHRLAAFLMQSFRTAKRQLKVLFLILLFYLLQVCVVPYFRVADVMPNLLMVVIAILTVSCGKKYAFISGAALGVIMEAQAHNINSFYVIVYPTLALIFAQLFADMNDMQRAVRRTKQKEGGKTERQKLKSAEGTRLSLRRLLHMGRLRDDPGDDLPAHLRILLNAVSLHAAYEVLMLFYVALSGVPVGFVHIFRAVRAVIYTGAACVFMYPARLFLGVIKLRSAKKIGEDLTAVTTKERVETLREITVIQDDMPPDAVMDFERRRDSSVLRIEEDAPAPVIAHQGGDGHDAE